jgi:hypothetical protein
MGLWQDTNGWLVPKLSPLQNKQQSMERSLEFRLAGAFFALYMITMTHLVPKVSPHVMLLLLCGSCPPDLKYLRSSDPGAATTLAPWFSLLDNGGSPALLDTPTIASVRHLLAEYLGKPVSRSHVCSSCTRTDNYSTQVTAIENADVALREQYTTALWNNCLFGRSSVKTHLEWLSLVSGFRLNGAPINVSFCWLCECSNDGARH